MTERNDARLPEEAEQMLRDWPAPEQSDAFWDAAAADVVACIQQAEVEGTPDDLLADPLPATPDEGTAAEAKAPTPIVRKLPKRDENAPRLADLARARSKGAAAERDAAAIAKESLSLLKEEGRTGARASTVAAAATSGRGQVVELEQVRPVESRQSQPVAGRQDSRTGLMAAMALVAVGLAAGAVLVIRAQTPASPAAEVVAMAPPVADRAAEPPAPAESPREPTDRARSVSPEDDPEAAVAAEDLPVPDPARPGPAKRARQSTGAVAAEDVALAEEKARSGTPAAPVATEDPDDELRPALDQALPLEPTPGAIASALGSGLAPARRCVVGHDRPSYASINFGSSGRVRSVTVTGPAAGTPAEACIRQSLSGIRLPRFSRPDFTVSGVAIRP